LDVFPGQLAKLLRVRVSDRFEVVFGEQHGRARALEPRREQTRNDEILHGFLLGRTVVHLEKPLLHPRELAADVAGVERNAQPAQRLVRRVFQRRQILQRLERPFHHAARVGRELEMVEPLLVLLVIEDSNAVAVLGEELLEGAAG